MNKLGYSLVSLLLAAWTACAAAEATLTLGIFAYRPKPVMTARFAPLAEYLDRAVPEAAIRLEVLTQPEMEAALAAGRLDLVFTNPSHYVLLRHHSRLTGAMATLVALEKGQPASQLGGVILAPADRQDIDALADLRGRRIAVPGIKYLGGYQTQAYELLRAGIDLRSEARIDEVGSHDAVVEALLAGRADAGFVRTGIVEAMYREGRLPAGRLKVVNPQRPPDFPYLISTRLYPEWAFAALPHVDPRIASGIARALLGLGPDSPVARAAGIHGFIVPADYLPVEELARALRLPPFEGAPEFTPGDVWTRYRTSLLAGLAGGAAMLAMAAGLFLANRRLRLAETALRKSEAGLRALLDNTPYLMWLKDRDSRFIAVNRAFADSAGQAGETAIVGRRDADLWPAELAERYRAEDLETMASGQQKWIEAQESHRGRPCWMETYKTPILDADGRLLGTAGFARDISERRERERLRLAEEMAHRDTLVREVHHRIKNNLQSVAALLRRKLGQFPELDASLESAITQVHAIAIVHGLQGGRTGEDILLCDSIDHICRVVREQSQRPLAWRPGDRRPCRVRIDRDEAVAIALVLNELVLNALKHSPADGPEPVVEAAPEGGAVRVTVRNRVAGPPVFDYAGNAGLGTGLRLVRSLLPEQGAALRYELADGWLSAHLTLGAPVLQPPTETGPI